MMVFDNMRKNTVINTMHREGGAFFVYIIDIHTHLRQNNITKLKIIITMFMLYYAI